MRFQEISDLLANNITLEEEEDVQKELLALQQDVVRTVTPFRNNLLISLQLAEQSPKLHLPSVPTESPVKSPQQEEAEETSDKVPVKREKVAVLV